MINFIIQNPDHIMFASKVIMFTATAIIFAGLVYTMKKGI